MNIAILGFGSQGASALAYYQAQGGHTLTVCDENTDLDLPNDVKKQLGKNYLDNLNEYDLLVRSPSLHPKKISEANSDHPAILEKVTTNTNIFMEVCPSRNIIGVTGTKGKGTTSTLIATMLEASGFRAHIGGNIGTPPLEMLANDIQPDDWVVLELANFQLIDLHSSPHIAVCLMVEPEHLDWHTDVDEYVGAKQQLFKWQSQNDIAVHYANNKLSTRVASVSIGKQLAYFGDSGALIREGNVVIDRTEICNVSEIGLPGEHNWQNVCAAVTAVWQVTQDIEAIKYALRTITSLPFRIELRDVINDVSFYNDSFATAPGATIAAIKAIVAPKILIVGGYDRGLDLTPLASVIKENESTIRQVIIIGASGKRLAEALNNCEFETYRIEESKDMTEIVRKAFNESRAGDAILLSPAFASFDMFKNFEVRGNAFNEAVEELA